jgi:hypothetical protein
VLVNETDKQTVLRFFPFGLHAVVAAGVQRESLPMTMAETGMKYSG